jgi:hypothetical protein
MSVAIPAQKTSYYFISYSRQEVAFVDSFARELEKRGVRTWVDFRNLVPGRPWQDQLDEGVSDAEAILLVVSRASMSSQPVKDEWTKSLAKGRRIILIGFEPCRLDPGLKGLEWVDFTRHFDKAMDKLMGLRGSSSQSAASRPPQRWTGLPGHVKGFMVLSLLLAFLCACIAVYYVGLNFYVVYSIIHKGLDDGLLSNVDNLKNFKAAISQAATDFFGSQYVLKSWQSFGGTTSMFIWIPIAVTFTWLPIRLFRRTHHAQNIKVSLDSLFYSGLYLITVAGILCFQAREQDSWVSKGFALFSIGVLLILLISSYLNRLLVSDAMYRWAGRTGVLIRSRAPDLTRYTENGAPMRVAIEYAPQDRLYAEVLKTHIEQAGHTCTDGFLQADRLLVLLSTYKTNSIHDPELFPVIPILIQDCSVDKRLSQVQWIDLRFGNLSMNAVAHLLDEPAELSRMLGVLPVRTTILPNIIKWLAILLWFLLVIAILLTYGAIFFDVGAYLDPSTPTQPYKIAAIILLPGLYFLRRYLVNRRLPYLSVIPYWWAVAFAIFLVPFGYYFVKDIFIAFLLIPLMMLHRDVKLWLPTSVKKPA